MKTILYLLCLLALPALAQQPATEWQQQANYSIEVALDDQRHELRGHEQIVYTNHSPDVLPFIWFHLWPNAYRDNTTAFARQQLRNGNRAFQFATPAQRGFIDSLEFRVNGQSARLEYDTDNPDMARLLLPQPLAAGASITITTPFRVKIPDSFSRLAHVGQHYQITQWYPKPAVYDRKGWHPMPYLSQGEFYSEFGSFDVRITLPANYVVGATGVLQNPEELARLDALAAIGASKKTAEDFGSDLKFPASAPETKTLRYVQDRIHDFAWFADKRFNVLKSGITLPSGRTVTSWVMFTNREATQWIKGLQDVNEALSYYSRWVGEYPYASATAVDGVGSAGAGMEYPMVTITPPVAIVHEVGHNWFYGVLGSNERDFAWMDEGLNTYTQKRVAERDTAAGGAMGLLSRWPLVETATGIADLPAVALDRLPIAALAARGFDQPVSGVTSADYGRFNYTLITYSETALLLQYLAGYLGQERFDAAMRAYYQQWQFHHPYPEDMQAAFEQATGQKLDWFFQQMLTSQHPYEAALSDLLVQGETLKVLVRNDSPAPFAVPVSTLDARGRVLETKWTPAFGGTDDDTKDETQLDFRAAGVTAVVIDAGYLTPQLNRRDDRMKVGGTLRRLEPLHLRPLASLERWDQQAINWMPVLGANTSDKFMLGVAFYNNLLVPKRLNYLAMPMYSFNRRELNGIGMLTLNVLPQARARQLLTTVQLTRFERYRKIEPSLTLHLPHSAFNRAQHLVRFANTNIRDQDRRQTTRIQTLEYLVRDGNALQNWSGHVELNQLSPNAASDNTSQNATLLRATATYGRYYNPTKQIRARLFGGAFLNSGSESPFAMGLSGSFDYRRQTMFLDRRQISHTYPAQFNQTDDRDGGFKAYLPVASQKWLTTLGLEADLPVTPLVIFADFGLVNRAGQSNSGRVNGYYDAGLVLPVTRLLLPIPNNILRLYLPLVGSQYGNGLPGSRKEFTDQIRFVFHFEELSPFRVLNQRLAQ